MRNAVISVALLILALPAMAQIETPQVSPKASVSQRVGTTDITIEYHRPGVKGRQIWGGLVPFDQPWRMGANEATTIEFSDPVMVEGKSLAAGTYSFFAIPGQESWTLVINKDPDQWGAYGYDQEKDALRVSVKPVPAAHTEWMRFNIEPTSPASAVVTLNWEKMAVPMNVAVPVNEIVWKSVDSALASDYASAAGFALETGERLEQGLGWIDQSIAMSGESVFNLFTKARLLQKLGRSGEAVPIMEKALAMAEGNVPADFMNLLKGSMASIKADAR